MDFEQKEYCLEIKSKGCESRKSPYTVVLHDRFESTEAQEITALSTDLHLPKDAGYLK